MGLKISELPLVTGDFDDDDYIVVNYEDSGTIKTARIKKSNLLKDVQDELTFDNAPVENSQNPVTSGGVFSAIKEANIQPDWEQSDDTANDYIKNRPFYKKPVHTDYVLDNMVIDGTMSYKTAKSFYNPEYNVFCNYSYYKTVDTDAPIVVGRKYSVTIELIEKISSATFVTCTDLIVTCYGMRKQSTSGIIVPFLVCGNVAADNYFYLNGTQYMRLFYDPDEKQFYVCSADAYRFNNGTYAVTIREADYDLVTISEEFLPNPLSQSKYAPSFFDETYVRNESIIFKDIYFLGYHDSKYYKYTISSIANWIMFAQDLNNYVDNLDYLNLDTNTLPYVITAIVNKIKALDKSTEKVSVLSKTISSLSRRILVLEKLHDIFNADVVYGVLTLTGAEVKDGVLRLSSGDVDDGVLKI